MSRRTDEDLSDAPLTPLENRKIRKIIRDQERMDWLWAVLRIWGTALFTVVTALYATRDWIARVWRAAIG